MIAVSKMKKTLCLIISVCLLSAGPVFADEKIMMSAAIPYEDKDVGNADIQKDCDWNQQLAENIVKESNSIAETTDKDLAQINGKTLTILSDNIHSIGGGAMTGPKWVHIHGQLSDNGKVIASFEALRRTIGGRLTACSTLNNLGDELAEDVGKWLKNPTMNAKLGDAN